jgi:hypothetical protein
MAEDDPAVVAALASLPALEPGRKDEKRYQQVVLQLLAFVFDQSLENFDTEYRMDGGRGRIDIIADNRANGGFFLDARSDLDAVTVPMECKNYGGDLGNEEFNQLADRMGPKTSRLGFLVCRSTDQAALGRHTGDRWLRQDLLIVVIDDVKLVELAQLRLARDFDRIQSRLRRWVRDVQYGRYR